MTDEQSSLFEVLEPPRGGLAGLRARLDRDQRRRGQLRFVRAVAAAVVVLAAISLPLWAPWERNPMPEMDFALSRMSLGLTPLPEEPVTIPASSRTEMAAQRIPLETDRVVFYLVAFRTPADLDAEAQ